MSKTTEEILTDYITKNSAMINEIVQKLETAESNIVEIYGRRGSGQFLIFNRIIKFLTDSKIDHRVYIPHVYRYNQLRDIVKLLTGVEGTEFDNIVEEGKKLGLSDNRFDFFYFLTTRLERDNLFLTKKILIYESYYLDEYCLDFIHYLVQYFTKEKLSFVIFSGEESFTFSEKIKLEYPDKNDIRQMLKSFHENSKSEFIVESEMVYKISQGDLFIIGYLFNRYFREKEELDFASPLEKQVTIESIYKREIKELSEEQKRLIFTILLLDTETDRLNDIINTKTFKKDIETLKNKKLIFEYGGNYFVIKVSAAKESFNSLSKAKQKALYTPVISDKKNTSSECLKIFLIEANVQLINKKIHYLNSIKDFDALIVIYKLLLEKPLSTDLKVQVLEKLGQSYKMSGDPETATETLRKALKICMENSLPAENIIYSLAENLLSINSANFALEIIRKYSPESIDQVMKCRILLLKAEIMMDMEDFEEAISITDSANQNSNRIDDERTRYEIKAKLRKIKGLIYYYSNDWTKAESEFLEAEKLFREINDYKGLAAINNNLGGLTMLQGGWDKTESYFLKSLEFEKKCFSLSGISGCYSNLGYLFEDKSDYERSLHYLNEALKIQKLLGDRDVISTIYINIGVTYMDNGKYKEAEEAFNKLLELALKYNLYRNVIAALNNLGALNFKSGDWYKARDFYERAIKKSEEHNFSEGICKSYNNLGELYEKRSEFMMAFECYSKSEELLPKFSDDFLKAELFGNLGSVLTALHKFKDAYGYLVESYDFFKNLNAKDKVVEGAQKQAYYFIETRNYESANYYLDIAEKIAEELSNDYQIGKCFFFRSLLEKSDSDAARKFLKQAIEKFVKSNNNFDLALANYELASHLFAGEEWEQALQILNENKKIIKSFGAIKFLEKNDIFIQKIKKKYAAELNESKLQENLLNKFYEITQGLNEINDFDVLLENALDRMTDFSEAEGGIFCLYPNHLVKDSWEYLILNNLSNTDEDFPALMKNIQTTYDENKSFNYKQPHFAPEYNNILSFPLSVRNERKGVICLFTKHGSHYFTERMYNLLNALCNQIIVIVENISYSNLQKAHEVIREELSATSTFANIIGKSPKIQEIFSIIDKIKDTPTTILLEGESGTGKELVARAIHFNSNRRNKKFVAQYCGALPETLLESELFGHVKGSFTGATHDKKGLFEIANGGTFFLDEIADISLSTQAKLLRFLQAGEIKRVGSTRIENVDVRVICATNVSLKNRVEKGDFRLDLFYRLNVIKIEVPSLKERKSDIPLLAVHFLDKYCNRIDKKINGITEEAMKYLSNYDWPGNIRQLENEIERAVTLADVDSYIKSADFSEEIFRFRENTETINLLEKKSLKDAVEQLEKQMIIRALQEFNWNQTKTAKELGLSRQGLIKKIQRYKLEK